MSDNQVKGSWNLFLFMGVLTKKRPRGQFLKAIPKCRSSRAIERSQDFLCFAVRDLYWGRAYCFWNFIVQLNKTQTFRNENIFFAFCVIWPFVSHNTTFSRVKVELSCRPSLFNYGLELYKGTFQARQKYYIWMCKRNWPLAGFT